MLKNLLQKMFNFGPLEETNAANATSNNEEHSKAIQRKRDLFAECKSLLQIAGDQRIEKKNDEVLITLEKIVEIMEREGL
ncbi:MAG: hypothetical protein FWF87_01660 [Synergistaceae bacterium]|nr:hypothetical protein [Synergistaceae bacterium]